MCVYIKYCKDERGLEKLHVIIIPRFVLLSPPSCEGAKVIVSTHDSRILWWYMFRVTPRDPSSLRLTLQHRRCRGTALQEAHLVEDRMRV